MYEKIVCKRKQKSESEKRVLKKEVKATKTKNKQRWSWNCKAKLKANNEEMLKKKPLKNLNELMSLRVKNFVTSCTEKN